MNIGYLLSILDLYLIKEKNSSLIVEVDNRESLVKVDFCYSFDPSNRTFVKIKKELFFEHLSEFLNKIQGSLLVEGENFVTKNNKKVYTLEFLEKRKISFINFSVDEMNMIRSNISNLKDKFDFNMDNITYDKKLETVKNTKLSFSMGFSSYMTLTLTSIWFLVILIISLLIFKNFIS